MRHFTVELEELNQKLLEMGGLVESAIHRSVRALVDQDRDLAEQVIRDEPRINRMEMEIDGMATRLLALRQPVARDLRFLTSALKINNDLERIADLAVNIAQQGERLAEHAEFRVEALPFDLAGMTRKVQWMLKSSLDALVNSDTALAQEVRGSDDAVDAIHRGMYGHVEEEIVRHPAQAGVLIHLLTVSRNLERIADHAVNIAEDVIYMVQGDITRHQRKHGGAPAGEPATPGGRS